MLKKEIQRTVKDAYDYEPTNEDELRLVVGELFEVYADEEEGWARGCSKRDVEEVFPTNFLRS